MLDTEFKSKNLLNSPIYGIQKNSKPKLKIEYGKYYLLNTENYYFCPDLRRKVKFIGKVAIKCGSKFGDDGFFGELINTEIEYGPDYQTNVDIEFGADDVISEYELRDMPLFFMDFNQKKNKIIYNNMGLDNYTRVVYGWKVEGRKNVEKFEKELEKINEDYYDDYFDFFVSDNMCGEYIYFGANLVNYDADDGDEVIIDNNLIKEKTNEYHGFLKEHPELDEFLQKQIGKLTTSKDPQMFIFQQIW